MKWFKHYSTLHEKDFSQRLIRKHGIKAYGRYMILLEMCIARANDRDDGCYALDTRLLSRSIACHEHMLSTCLAPVALEMGFSFTPASETFVFDIPILAELRHKDSMSWKKRRATGGPQAGRLARLDLEEEKEEEKEKYTNAQNMLKPSVVSEIDFDNFYSKYPRKVGKERGRKTFKTQIKTPEDLLLIHAALNNYIGYIKKNVQETRFILHFSTFMNSWRDWLDPNAGLVEGNLLGRDDSWKEEFKKQLADRERSRMGR